MKIVSVFVFAAALISTWCLANSHDATSQSIHVGVQNDLKNIIAEYLQKNLPESKDLRFERFWTESLKSGVIKATFAYSFTEPSNETGETRVAISGSAILNKVEEDNDLVTYNLDELQILDNTVRFEEPIQITASGSPHELEKEPTAEEMNISKPPSKSH